MPMVTKFVRLVAYNEDLALINSRDLTRKRSGEVTCQIKYITYPLAEDLWTPNQARY